MGKMEKFLRSSILDKLCDERLEKYETICARSFNDGEKNNIFDDFDLEQDIIYYLNQNINDENVISEIRKKMNDFMDGAFRDIEISNRRAYKLGFIDGYKINKEIYELFNKM